MPVTAIAIGGLARTGHGDVPGHLADGSLDASVCASASTASTSTSTPPAGRPWKRTQWWRYRLGAPPVALPAVPEFQTSPGMRDILAPESDRWRRFVDVFADVVEAAGYGPDRAADDRGHRRVPARRRGHRRRHQGDVRLHRPRRPPRRAAPRADGERLPGVRPAPPDRRRGRSGTPGRNFRYEKPQRGRYRQFDQVGIEVLGVDDPYLDVEVIALGWRFFEALGLRQVTLLLNSLGEPADRARYVDALRAHFDAARSTRSPPRAARRSSATRCACSTPSARQDAAVIAAAPALADFLERRRGRALRRRARPASTRSASRTASSPGSCAASTTTCARRSSSPAARSTAPRTRSAAAAATTGSSRRSAGRRRPASGSPSASTARCSPATTRACSPPPTPAVDVFVVDTTGGARGARRHRRAAPRRPLGRPRLRRPQHEGADEGRRPQRRRRRRDRRRRRARRRHRRRAAAARRRDEQTVVARTDLLTAPGSSS